MAPVPWKVSPVSGVELVAIALGAARAERAGLRGHGGAGTARGGSAFPGLHSRTAPAQLRRAVGRAQAPDRTVVWRLGAGDAQVDMSHQARLVPDSCTRAACVCCTHRPCLGQNTSPGGAGQTSHPRHGDRGRRAAQACGLGQRAVEPSGLLAKAPAVRGVHTATVEPVPQPQLLLS